MLTKKCVVCGKELIKNQKSFCSRRCFYKYQDKRKVIECETCGKRGKWKRRFCSHECYRISKIGIKATGGQLESLKKGWYKSGKLSKEHVRNIKKNSFWKGKYGKAHPKWVGGATAIGAAVRTMQEYKDWRKDVFERDKYKCQKCGRYRKPGDRVVLQAHHKKPFYKIMEDNKIKTIDDARECSELWDINNGETLCIPCHKQTDSYLVNQHTK